MVNIQKNIIPSEKDCSSYDRSLCSLQIARGDQRVQRPGQPVGEAPFVVENVPVQQQLAKCLGGAEGAGNEAEGRVEAAGAGQGAEAVLEHAQQKARVPFRLRLKQLLGGGRQSRGGWKAGKWILYIEAKNVRKFKKKLNIIKQI